MTPTTLFPIETKWRQCYDKKTNKPIKGLRMGPTPDGLDTWWLVDSPRGEMSEGYHSLAAALKRHATLYHHNPLLARKVEDVWLKPSRQERRTMKRKLLKIAKSLA